MLVYYLGSCTNCYIVVCYRVIWLIQLVPRGVIFANDCISKQATIPDIMLGNLCTHTKKFWEVLQLLHYIIIFLIICSVVYSEHFIFTQDDLVWTMPGDGVGVMRLPGFSQKTFITFCLSPASVVGTVTVTRNMFLYRNIISMGHISYSYQNMQDKKEKTANTDYT